MALASAQKRLTMSRQLAAILLLIPGGLVGVILTMAMLRHRTDRPARDLLPRVLAVWAVALLFAWIVAALAIPGATWLLVVALSFLGVNALWRWQQATSVGLQPPAYLLPFAVVCLLTAIAAVAISAATPHP